MISPHPPRNRPSDWLLSYFEYFRSRVRDCSSITACTGHKKPHAALGYLPLSWLLRSFRRHGVRILGVDPAVNLAELASDSGVDRYTGYFDSRTAHEIAGHWGQASLVTATNTFPHIPVLRDFMKGIDTVLAPEGAFVVDLDKAE